MRKQKGLGIVSIFFLLALLFVGAIIAMKCFPVYLEYFAVKRTFAAMSSEIKNASAKEVKDKFQARASIDDIKSITANDLEISKEGGVTVVSTVYQVTVPLFANVSLLLDFHASTQQ
jgi:Domain of unknown function (DUF4845)